MKSTIALLVFLICGNAVLGQVPMGVDSKYGKPTIVYSVSDSIWMSPEFASDGQICQMTLFPKRFESKAIYLLADISSSELENVLSRLVPLNTRGKAKDPFGATTTGGNAIWSIYSYENVSFLFSASMSRKGEPVKQPEPFVLSEKVMTMGDPPQNSPSSGDIPIRSDFNAEVVTIKWNNPVCKKE